MEVATAAVNQPIAVSNLEFVDNFTPVDYSLILTLADGLPQEYDGFVNMTAIAKADTDVLYLHYHGIYDGRAIKQVTVMGDSGYGPISAESTKIEYDYNGGFYKITFNYGMPARYKMHFKIQFSGLVGNATEAGGIFYGNHTRDIVIADGTRAADIFPCINLDKYRAPFLLVIYRYGGVKCFANSEIDEENAQFVRFKTTQPLKASQMGFVVIDEGATLYERHDASTDTGVPLSVYSVTEKNLDAMFAVTQKIWKWNHENLKVAFPAKKLNIFIFDDERVPDDWIAPSTFVGLIFERSAVLTTWDNLEAFDLLFTPEMNRFRVAWGIAQTYFQEMCAFSDPSNRWLHNGLSMFLASQAMKQFNYSTRDDQRPPLYSNIEDLYYYRFTTKPMTKAFYNSATMPPMNDTTQNISTVCQAFTFIRHLVYWSGTEHEVLHDIYGNGNNHAHEAAFVNAVAGVMERFAFNQHFALTFQDVLSELIPSMTATAEDLKGWLVNPAVPIVTGDAFHPDGMGYKIEFQQQAVLPCVFMTIGGYSSKSVLGASMSSLEYWSTRYYGTFLMNYRCNGYYITRFGGPLLERALVFFSTYMRQMTYSRFQVVRDLAYLLPLDLSDKTAKYDVERMLLYIFRNYNRQNVNYQAPKHPLEWQAIYNFVERAMAIYDADFIKESLAPAVSVLIHNVVVGDDPYYTPEVNPIVKKIAAQMKAVLSPYEAAAADEKMPFAEIFAKLLGGEALSEEEMNIKEATFTWRGMWSGVEGVAELKTIYDRSDASGEKILCLKAMVRATEEDALKEALEFALQEAKKLQSVAVVLKSVAKSREGTRFARRFLAEREMREAAALLEECACEFEAPTAIE